MCEYQIHVVVRVVWSLTRPSLTHCRLFLHEYSHVATYVGQRNSSKTIYADSGSMPKLNSAHTVTFPIPVQGKETATK